MEGSDQRRREVTRGGGELRLSEVEGRDETWRGAISDSDERWRRVIRSEGEPSQIHGPLRPVTRHTFGEFSEAWPGACVVLAEQRNWQRPVLG